MRGQVRCGRWRQRADTARLAGASPSTAGCGQGHAGHSPDPAERSSAKLLWPTPWAVPSEAASRKPSAPTPGQSSRVAESGLLSSPAAPHPERPHLGKHAPAGARASVREYARAPAWCRERGGRGRGECGPGAPCRPRGTRRLPTRGQQRFRGPTSGSSKLPPNDHRPRTGPAGLGSARPPQTGLPPVRAPALDNGLGIYRRPE